MCKGKSSSSANFSPIDSAILSEVVTKLDQVAATMKKMAEAFEKRESSLDQLVESKVNQYMEEQSEKEKRERNIVFHNILESDSEEPEKRKQYDSMEVKAVLEYLDIEDTQEALKPIRLGKKLEHSEKPRLLKVTVDSVETKRKILFKAKSLRNSKSDKLSNIYVTPDLTSKEREAGKKLRDELRARRSEGEEVMIRGGKIVEARKSSFRGLSGEFPDREEQAKPK